MGNLMKRYDSNEIKTEVSENKTAQTVKSVKPLIGEKLTRNVMIAALLLACVVGMRDVAVSPDQTVLDVLQNAVKSEWDENLGRLVYVNSTLSEAIQVFGSTQDTLLYQPSSAEIIQTFSASSPYIVYRNADTVYSAAEGEVMSVSHTDNDAYVIRVQCKNDLECLYYGLQTCAVSEGDIVDSHTILGNCAQNNLAFEVRKDGKSMDASAYFAVRQTQ